MKKIISLLFCVCVFAVSAMAQQKGFGLEQVKQIKFLTSTRTDVEKIFGGAKQTLDDHVQQFELKNAKVEVTYSAGRCEDKTNKKTAPEWTAIRATIYPKRKLTLASTGIDVSRFESRPIYDAHDGDSYVNIDGSIGLDVINKSVRAIVFRLPKTQSEDYCFKGLNFY